MADEPDLRDVPEAVPVSRSRRSIQLVWLIPIIAAIVGAVFAVRAVLSHGPTIEIRFDSADGIEPGRTQVKYKSVDVGVVSSVSLADDRAGIIVKAEMSKSAEPLLMQDTRFWVVRPRISGGVVSGVSTLVSGRYIGMDTGTSTEPRRDFQGLERPPALTSGMKGKEFVLRADDIGSLDIGSPLYFRRLQAGQVIDYSIAEKGDGVVVRVFVNSPYDQYVSPNTRFWHASGVDVSLDASGLKIDTQSVAAILLGGVAFQDPEDAGARPPAEAGHRFSLHDTRATAMSQPERPAEVYALRLEGSVRGLAVGAPVDFRGLNVGTVRSIELQRDFVKREFPFLVTIAVQSEKIVGHDRVVRPDGRPALEPLIARGLRASLRTANLLTGQKYVALSFFPDKRKVVKTNVAQVPLEIPVVDQGGFTELQTTIASIAAKLDKVPFDRIGNDLATTMSTANTVLLRIDREITPNVRDTLQSAKGALDEYRTDIAPEARQAIAEARKAMESLSRATAETGPLQNQAAETLRELERAARAFRLLADYLERHPEALIRGKREPAQ